MDKWTDEQMDNTNPRVASRMKNKAEENTILDPSFLEGKFSIYSNMVVRGVAPCMLMYLVSCVGVVLQKSAH